MTFGDSVDPAKEKKSPLASPAPHGQSKSKIMPKQMASSSTKMDPKNRQIAGVSKAVFYKRGR